MNDLELDTRYSSICKRATVCLPIADGKVKVRVAYAVDDGSTSIDSEIRSGTKG